ncbi:hypothetical protein [Mycobacterium marinum]
MIDPTTNAVIDTISVGTNPIEVAGLQRRSERAHRAPSRGHGHGHGQ